MHKTQESWTCTLPSLSLLVLTRTGHSLHACTGPATRPNPELQHSNVQGSAAGRGNSGQKGSSPPGGASPKGVCACVCVYVNVLSVCVCACECVSSSRDSGQKGSSPPGCASPKGVLRVRVCVCLIVCVLMFRLWGVCFTWLSTCVAMLWNITQQGYTG